MKYARQVQISLDKLDNSLAKLRTMIKRGQNQDAIRFMEEGELKERFGDLQSMINISSINPLGSRGTAQTGTL